MLFVSMFVHTQRVYFFFFPSLFVLVFLLLLVMMVHYNLVVSLFFVHSCNSSYIHLKSHCQILHSLNSIFDVDIFFLLPSFASSCLSFVHFVVLYISILASIFLFLHFLLFLSSCCFFVCCCCCYFSSCLLLLLLVLGNYFPFSIWCTNFLIFYNWHNRFPFLFLLLLILFLILIHFLLHLHVLLLLCGVYLQIRFSNYSYIVLFLG
mmetsp:Transcript_7833/g.11625  ORF Transcript_7833/g.11625 Transcript_7833/m.11625 type:complete len:207 (-) Transcript_7833:38-658(-)